MSPDAQPTPRPRATITDVANLAGVGTRTVSRVMNGAANVDAELAARIRRAAQQLNYRPNLAASNLRRLRGRTATIGLLLEDIANPFSAALQRAVEDVARARGYGVLATSLDEDPARERALAMTLIDRRADGLIIVPAGHDHSYLLDEQRAGTKLVFVDRPAHLLAADCVTSANREGAYEAVAHLVAHGHRRIAYLGDLRSIATAEQRFAGYRDAVQKLGCAEEPGLIIRDLHTEVAAEAAATALMQRENPPTAIFTSQNLVTIGCVRALRGLKLENTIALVGFDDFPLSDLLSPGVTTVAQDPTGLGKAAAELLFERIEGASDGNRSVVLPTRLIPRGSGEIASTVGTVTKVQPRRTK